MKQIIVIVIIAIFSAMNLVAQNSKKAIHIIDGVYVENFDGSQLVGKTIKSYSIDTEDNINVIFTSDYTKGGEMATVEVKKVLASIKMDTGDMLTVSKVGPQVTVVNVDGKGSALEDKTIVFVVDGKEVTPTFFNGLDPQNIKSIEIVNNKSSENFKKYAKENTSKVMIIATKE